MKFKNKKTKLFLVLGASTLALGGVGFASWVIGVQQKNAEANLQLEVDTASLGNVNVTYQMTNKKVTIKETTAQKGENLIVNPTEVDANALKFTIDEIVVKVGTGVSESDRPKTLKITLPTEKNAANIVSDKQHNIIETSKGVKYRTDAPETNTFTYLEYSKEIALDYAASEGGVLTKDENYFTFRFTTDVANQTFTLGTYFDYVNGTPAGENPTTSVSEFYNKIYESYPRTTEEETDFLMAQAVNIKDELTQMHTALNKENALTLRISLE